MPSIMSNQTECHLILTLFFYLRKWENQVLTIHSEITFSTMYKYVDGIPWSFIVFSVVKLFNKCLFALSML